MPRPRDIGREFAALHNELCLKERMGAWNRTETTWLQRQFFLLRGEAYRRFWYLDEIWFNRPDSLMRILGTTMARLAAHPDVDSIGEILAQEVTREHFSRRVGLRTKQEIMWRRIYNERRQDPKTPIPHLAVLKCLARGMSIAELARQTNVSKEAMWQRAKVAKHGIKWWDARKIKMGDTCQTSTT